MKNKARYWQMRLFWGLGLGVLVCFTVAAGLAKAMAPLANKDRKELVQELYANYKKCFPEVPEVSPEEAMKLVQEGQAVLVDVRPAAERAVSRLPGAISKIEFMKSPPDIYRGKTVIAYDTIGYRSGLFVKKLREKGLDLANLQGGLLGWLHAGGKLYDDWGETTRVHVYGSLWNYAPLDCETVR
jgi:rhodanese-related sulfurtransferase